EIRSAFRRLARQYHPDVNPDPAAPERFRAVVAAYELLSDPSRRAQYEASRSGRSTWRSGTAGRRPAPGRAPDQGVGPRRGVSTMPPVRGLDRHSTLRVTADMLQSGGTGTLSHRRWERCDRCGGFGRLQEEVACTACDGTGFHGGHISDPCKVCWTTGTTTVCPECSGKGGLWRAKRIDVTIPPGARYSQQLRLRGMGDVGPRGGAPGDLYVELAPPLPAAVQAVASHELVQAALRRLEEWLDRFAPYPA
ncbi:MAG TPA: DnaJ domain-containing protein, partial [Chloroflexota bacterium]|nr:DnaJ domain-containing protein [Chloroflexota bacterium]